MLSHSLFLPWSVQYTNAACQQEHTQSSVLARMVEYSDIYNWHCYSHVKDVGKIDFTRYCESLQGRASLDGTPVYDWHCVLSGQSTLIDTDAACQWQYNESDALSSVSDYFDPNG